MADIKAGKGKGEHKFAMAVSPLDCMGCGVCISQCGVHAIEMVPMESQIEQQEVFDYMVEKVSEKKDMFVADNVKFSQFAQPYLEFSGSCAGCAETSYARLVTQLFGDHMIISNATGCSSIWGGPAATSPVHRQQGRPGPAWRTASSRITLSTASASTSARRRSATTSRGPRTSPPQPATRPQRRPRSGLPCHLDDGSANQEPRSAFSPSSRQTVPLREREQGPCNKDYLNKKSMWIFGGDGWAYDIGFGGVDHVLASGEDVNIFVFNTEVYSNTGGQASKASNIGQVAQFAAAGKEIKSKSRRDRHDLRLRLRGAGRHGRKQGADPQGHR